MSVDVCEHGQLGVFILVLCLEVNRCMRLWTPPRPNQSELTDERVVLKPKTGGLACEGYAMKERVGARLAVGEGCQERGCRCSQSTRAMRLKG